MTNSGYKFIDHPSDIGIEVKGKTHKELFLNAVSGMLSIISDSSNGREKIKKSLHLEEGSLEELLHSFLSEILWFIISERFLPLSVSINLLEKTTLQAHLEGITITDEEVKREIKAVTFHQLKIEKINGYFLTRIIFDV